MMLALALRESWLEGSGPTQAPHRTPLAPVMGVFLWYGFPTHCEWLPMWPAQKETKMSARGLPNNVGSNAARAALSRLGLPYATQAEMSDDADDGMLLHTKDGSLWRYDSASVLVADDVLVKGAATTGRWLRCAGTTHLLDVASIEAGVTVDAETLLTIPTGCIIKPLACWWKVTVAFTGGTSSAIGIDSDNAALATPGDLLGGASGDVLAGLTIGEARGTIGAAIASPGAILEAGDTIDFNEITSAFTAGEATLRMAALVIANAGA